MSAGKRSRTGQVTPGLTDSRPPASKRQKILANGHAPTRNDGLEFLVDENARAGKQLKAELTNGLPTPKSFRADEARAIVAQDASDDEEDGDDDDDKLEEKFSTEEHGRNRLSRKRKAQNVAKSGSMKIIDISSAEESSELESEQGDEEVASGSRQTSGVVALTNGLHTKPSFDDDDAAATDNADEPTFGELLARHEGPIDVAKSLGKTTGQELAATSGQRGLSGLSSATLGTVLTQALKTNDKDQLELCFHVTDVDRIRATIQRLNSQHVATLLERISERIYSRPGRAGNLFVWIQWSLVVHGGYLSTHSEIIKKLKSLSRVIKERARGLQPLLHLKGKIDMLSAQLDLRRNVLPSAGVGSDQDNEDNVVYIEGQDETWSDEYNEPTGRVTRKAIAARSNRSAEEDSESDSDAGDGVLSNGLANGVDDDDSQDESEEDENDEGLLDIEAEEASDDDDEEGDSIEESDSDAESSAGEEESENDDDSEMEAVKQPKMNTLNRKR